MEIYIIELEKATNILLKENQTLSSWLQFINNRKVVSDMENEAIKKAKKVLEEISQDERERRLTELREKYILDQKAIHSHGYDKGLEQGLEQGRQQTQIELIQRMKDEDFDTSIISKITGLTEEEIDKILES